jgi:hypothetical protein
MNEDGWHCFLKCKQVKKCRQELQREAIRIQLLSLKSAREVVQHILHMKQDEHNIVISFLWVWWDTRNKLNAGEQARPMAEVLHRTMELSCSTKNQSMMQNDGPKNNG